MKKLTILVSTSILALTLSSCTTVMTAGVKKGDERNFARSLNDVNASRAIKARMGRVEGFSLGGVDVEVAEGIVVLSGNVPREEDRIEAERIAWSGPAIVQVGNEILIKARQSLVRNSKDGVLNNSVRARLIAAKAIKARNYNIEVNDGIVYLLGVARTPEELAVATQIASTTKGTKEVISYVWIAGDRSRMTAQGSGFNGQPSGSLGYTENNVASVPLPLTAPSDSLDGDAIDSGEVYYRDPKTGERIVLPDGVKPIPYVPDAGPGSLGAGGAPLPPGGVSAPNGRAYNIDPTTGDMVPVKY